MDDTLESLTIKYINTLNNLYLPEQKILVDSLKTFYPTNTHCNNFVWDIMSTNMTTQNQQAIENFKAHARYSDLFLNKDDKEYIINQFNIYFNTINI